MTAPFALLDAADGHPSFEERFKHVPGEKGPDTFFLYGVDVTTGERVAISRRGQSWPESLVLEAIARRVATLRLPSLARVLHAGPGIVFAAPPPALKRRALRDVGTAAIAELALQTCEVAAALHAAGVAGLPFSDRNPRLALDQGRLIVHWMVPTKDLGRSLFPFAPPDPWRKGRRVHGVIRPEEAATLSSPVKWDLWGLVHFFFTLLPSADSAEAFDAMRRSPAHLPPDVASLARAFAAAGGSPDLASRAAAIPEILSVPRFLLDWDAVIAEGEALLSRKAPDIARPLADAYHQRASRAWAGGAREAALRDAERAVALDGDWPPYRTTCAVLRHGLGQHRAARRLLTGGSKDTAGRAKLPTEVTHLSRFEEARIHATRGLISLRQGDVNAAEKDLRIAFSLAPTAFHAHAFGAARYALGDIEGAAEIEERSVALDPSCARYRWALVISLHKLGREVEARMHAREIVAREPENPAHQERYARMFGGAAPDDERKQ